MIRKFRITTVSDPITLTVSFDEDKLICIELPAGMDDGRKVKFLAIMPVTFDLFIYWIESKHFVIVEVPADLSFEAFWTKYNYKVGKKERAKKLWQVMTDEEHASALFAIAKYNSYLINHPTIERAYPETWLSQRRWENSF